MGSKSKVLPASQTISWNRIGSPPSLATLMVDVIEPDETALFAHFTFQFLGTAIEWITAPGIIDGYPIISDNKAEIPLQLQNIGSLSPSTYIANVFIDISNDSGVIRTLSSTIYFSLSGSATGSIATDAPVYNLIFNRANNTLSGDTAVGILNNEDDKLLTFSQPSPIFEPKTGFIDDFTIEDNLALSIADNPDLPNFGNIDHQCRIMGPLGEYITYFGINLLILDESGIGVTPSRMDFVVIKNTTEKSGVLSVVNPFNKDFTIQTPTWLIPSVSGGSTTMDINITTSTASLNAGFFTDRIKISTADGFIDVPVTLLVKQFITIENLPFNFCLDIPAVRFTRITENARYVKVTFSATYVVMGVSKTITHYFIIPYIDDQAKFELGQKLHNYFPRFRDHLFEIVDSAEFMKAITCNLILQELNVDYEVLMSENLNGLRFFPGSKPSQFPIFTNYPYRKKNKGSQFFITHAEDELVIVENITNVESINAITYDDKTIKFYNFPKVFQPIQMQWENGNLVPEWFTFTAEYSINADFTHITSKNILTSLIEKFETSKIKNLAINTGFILKQEIEMIEAMTENRLAFIKIGEKIYRCYNATPKLVLQSSSQSVIERDLQFIIVEE